MYSEQEVIKRITETWRFDNKVCVKELQIPLVGKNINYPFLENRKSIRIDLACYDIVADKIIFVEAENGLWLPHPQIYRPFCDMLYVATPYDDSYYREKQLEWAKNEGIGVIEILYDGYIIETLKPVVFPDSMDISLRDEVLEHFVKKLKKNEKIAD
ncbi:MAG: hypothetical protein K9W46_00540 [Candidatus Heimdallarchaeum endolithica]|uniref:Uncharacterized protein n=1 Tax=Candidatus Heimdallarchaeum endolithica TaxID=2876572 RepID=A0A9Y1BRL0_9ARCH|nr:MAG: hypothetical protein K9W46_00540 [Candidatus Heimdallarchaeum endolithica]